MPLAPTDNFRPTLFKLDAEHLWISVLPPVSTDMPLYGKKTKQETIMNFDFIKKLDIWIFNINVKYKII